MKKYTRLYGSYEQISYEDMKTIRTQIYDKYHIFLDIEKHTEYTEDELNQEYLNTHKEITQ